MTKVKRFNAEALYHALDKERQRREMTWTDISKEIRVSASTIARTKKGGRMEVDGMIAMVSWLGVPVETFIRETDR